MSTSIKDILSRGMRFISSRQSPPSKDDSDSGQKPEPSHADCHASRDVVDMLETALCSAAAILTRSCVIVAHGQNFSLRFGHCEGRHAVEAFDDELASALLCAARDLGSGRTGLLKTASHGDGRQIKIASLGNWLLIALETNGE